MPFDPSDNTANVLAVLTRACQLDCGYCRMRRGGPAMSRGLLKRTAAFLAGSRAASLELQLFGGEPLLVPDLVRAAVDEAEANAQRTGKEIRVVLTTNGLLLDQAMAAFLARRCVRVLLSLDGAPGNSGRKDVRADRVLGLLAGAGGEFFVNMVVPPEDAGRVAENARYLVAKGAREIQIAYALGVFWPEREARLLEAGLRSAAQACILRNRSSAAEPVLSSPQIIVDCDGTVSVGCALVLEERLPALARLCRVGKLGGLGGIAGLRRSRAEHLRFLRKGLAGTPDQAVLANNLVLGRRVREVLAHCS